MLLPLGRAHARIHLRQLEGGRVGRGSWRSQDGSALRTFPPLLFGPLTSNEEQAGREGRGCGGVGRARQARGRDRRGHVTATLASGRGGGTLPGTLSPPAGAAAPKQLPARKQQLRAHPASAGAEIPHLRPPLIRAALS